MEYNYLTVPPPFLGSGFRQNHQIRSLKSNSYPYLTSHRSTFPSSSHTSPSVSLLTSRGTGSSFHRTNLNSYRRKHLRRCYDLVHIRIQRREIALAARFLRVILAAHEWSSEETFRLALLLLSLASHEGVEEQEAQEEAILRRKIGFLQQADLNSSAPFKSTQITPALIAEYISANRLSDAMELLEQRVNVYPYKSQPELHCTLGLLYLFVGIQTLLNNNDVSENVEGGGEGGEGVNLRNIDRTSRTKAKSCFEAAIQASETWKRGEVGRRQRVYGMFRKDQVDVEKRVLKREKIWGTNPVDDAEDAWPVEEHKDLRKIRRRLEGEAVSDTEQEEEEEGGSNSENESSASGSVYADSTADPSFSEEDIHRRGRTQTRTPSTQSKPNPEPPTSPLPSPENPEEEPSKNGPCAWASVWPDVEQVFTPEPPLAYHMAKQFLDLLAPPVRASNSKRKVRGIARGTVFDLDPEGEVGVESGGSDIGEGFGVVGGIQLTREEAELRLRRILFEGGEDEVGGDLGVSVKTEKGKDREGREERRKRKRERREREHGSGNHHRREKRHRREERHF